MLTSVPFYLYDQNQNAGLSTEADVRTWFSLSLSTYCVIIKWERYYLDASSVYQPVITNTDVYLDANYQLKIPTTSPTPYPYTKSFFIRAATRSDVN